MILQQGRRLFVSDDSTKADLESLPDESSGLLLRHFWTVPLAEERPGQVVAKTCVPHAVDIQRLLQYLRAL